MKIGKFINYYSLFIFFIISLFLFSSSCKSRFSTKEIRKMESKALAGNFDSAMKLSDYYGIDLQDNATGMFWNCICFENNPEEGSWNFSQVNYLKDGKSLRYQYLIFLCEDYIKYLDSSSYVIQSYEKFHKEFAGFSFADDNLEYNSVSDENYNYFYNKAFSGSGLAALKIAQFYEKTVTQDIYASYKILLYIGCEYNPAEEVLPLFWYRIGAQNGNKECMKKYSDILKQSDDENDKIRAEFWENKINSSPTSSGFNSLENSGLPPTN